MPTSQTEEAMAIAHRQPLTRAADFAAAGIPAAVLTRLVRAGKLRRPSRGLYALPDTPLSENETLAQVASRAPAVVFCLLTALHLHQVTTQNPAEVWLAIPRKARPPRIDWPPLRVIHLSDDVFGTGIETRLVDGVPLRVYSLARTVADCFKFRSKVGLDVALEALRDALRSKRITMDELWGEARTCRVENVMRPYLESLVP